MNKAIPADPVALGEMFFPKEYFRTPRDTDSLGDFPLGIGTMDFERTCYRNVNQVTQNLEGAGK